MPKVSHTKREVINLLDALVGSDIEVTCFGSFVVPLDELPEQGLIRSLSSLEAKTDGVGLRLTGGSLSVRGAEVSRIRWSIQPEGKTANVLIIGERQLAITENYLEEALVWIDDQFQRLVLGRTSNEKP